MMIPGLEWIGLGLLLPILAFVVEGPDSGSTNFEAWYEWLQSQADADDVGAVNTNYSYEGSSGVVQNKDVTDVGPTSGVYDPEWQAFLAGEL